MRENVMESGVFVTADLHFSDINIIKYENRPFASADDMNKAIIENWNAVVKADDKIFVLGDVSFDIEEKTKEFISKLNGHKVLIMGNHDCDKDVNFWLNMGFNEVSRYSIVYEDFAIMSHEPPTYFNDASPYIYIYGHVHSTDAYKTITKQSACVSLERWDYAPVQINALFAEMITLRMNSRV